LINGIYPGFLVFGIQFTEVLIDQLIIITTHFSTAQTFTLINFLRIVLKVLHSGEKQKESYGSGTCLFFIQYYESSSKSTTEPFISAPDYLRSGFQIL